VKYLNGGAHLDHGGSGGGAVDEAGGAGPGGSHPLDHRLELGVAGLAPTAAPVARQDRPRATRCRRRDAGVDRRRRLKRGAQVGGVQRQTGQIPNENRSIEKTRPSEKQLSVGISGGAKKTLKHGKVKRWKPQVVRYRALS